MILREVNKEYVDIISYADLKKKKSFFFMQVKSVEVRFLGGVGVTIFHLDILII